MIASSASPIAVLDTSVLYPAWSRVLLLRLACSQPAEYRGIWSREIARELWRTFEMRGGARGVAPEQVRHEAIAALYPLRQAFDMVDAGHRPSHTPASPLSDCGLRRQPQHATFPSPSHAGRGWGTPAPASRPQRRVRHRDRVHRRDSRSRRGSTLWCADSARWPHPQRAVAVTMTVIVRGGVTGWQQVPWRSALPCSSGN